MTGVNGDFYLDIDTGNLYQKITGSWTLQMCLKGEKGDKGDAGDPGTPGTNGSTMYSGHGAPS